MENRQAMNKVELVGVVKEQKLKEGKNEKDNSKYINGSLVIGCGDSEVTLKVFVGEKTKENKVKKNYTTLKKFIDGEYLTMAKDKDEAAKVRVYGSGTFTPQFKEDLFVPEGTQECKSSINIDLGFGNIYVDEKGDITEEDFKAIFDVEMFVTDIEEEINKVGDEEEETGRVKVKGYVPGYNGTIFPLTVVAGKVEDEDGEFDFAEQIRDGINEGDSVNFWGDINYIKIIKKVKKGGALGKAKVEEKREYVHDLVATGGEVLEEDKEWEEENIEKAVRERTVLMKTKEDEAKSGDKKEKGLKSKDKPERKERKRPSF